MKIFDLQVQWIVPYKGDYLRRTKWHRTVRAKSLNEARVSVLSHYKDKICPSMSVGWEKVV